MGKAARERARLKRKSDRRGERVSHKTFYGPFDCPHCKKVGFWLRDPPKPGLVPHCTLCNRLLKKGVQPLPRTKKELASQSVRVLNAYVRRCFTASGVPYHKE